jgi:hypothetical protein
MILKNLPQFAAGIPVAPRRVNSASERPETLLRIHSRRFTPCCEANRGLGRNQPLVLLVGKDCRRVSARISPTRCRYSGANTTVALSSPLWFSLALSATGRGGQSDRGVKSIALGGRSF